MRERFEPEAPVLNHVHEFMRPEDRIRRGVPALRTTENDYVFESYGRDVVEIRHEDRAEPNAARVIESIADAIHEIGRIESRQGLSNRYRHRLAAIPVLLFCLTNGKGHRTAGR